MSDEIIFPEEMKFTPNAIMDWMIDHHRQFYDDLLEQLQCIFDFAFETSDGKKGLWAELWNHTDFFVAPASSKFHGNYPMGLAEHVNQVYNALYDVHLRYGLDQEQAARLALFHDFCKIGIYEPYLMKRPKGALRYEVVDRFPIGHGEKSVILACSYGIHLTLAETVAIRWHMGNYDYAYKQYESKAKEHFPAHRALQYADMMATDLEMTRGRPY